MRVGSKPHSNPFSTRFVRPGALPFRFPPGSDAASLAHDLERLGGWGQIIGPHGSGKSTLLAALLPHLRQRQTVVTVELHTDRRRWPDLAPLPPPALLVVDGFEQLSWWTRWRVRSLCRRWGWGLLVTAHADMGLPLLHRTGVDPSVAHEIVAALLSPDEQHLCAPDHLEQALARHRGNLRDVLFDLYDIYERSRGESTGTLTRRPE